MEELPKLQKIEEGADEELDTFGIKRQAQMELMYLAGGEEGADDWIIANGERFNRLMYDPQYNFIERLADEKTHIEALQELRSKLYH